MDARFLRLVPALLAFACVAAAADQVYRWVDKDGKVHYSQTPPAGTATNAQTVQVNAPPPDPTGQQNVQVLQKQLADKDQKAADAAKAAEQDVAQAAQKKQRCDDLRTRLITLQNSGRTATVDAQGNMTYLDDDARAKQVQEIQSEMKNAGCG